MKKIIFILLLCFTVAIATFAIDMSPHPGDTLETVFTVQDNVTMVWAEAAPAFENGLHLEQINTINYEICLTANEEMIESPYYFQDSDYIVVAAVSDNGYELENILLITNKSILVSISENYRGGSLHFAGHYKQIT